MNKVTIYTTKSCAYCPRVKKFLTLKNVEFDEVDVSVDGETRAELFKKTGMMTVPITTDGNNFVVGWNPAQLAKLVS